MRIRNSTFMNLFLNAWISRFIIFLSLSKNNVCILWFKVEIYRISEQMSSLQMHRFRVSIFNTRINFWEIHNHMLSRNFFSKTRNLHFKKKTLANHKLCTNSDCKAKAYPGFSVKADIMISDGLSCKKTVQSIWSSILSENSI